MKILKELIHFKDLRILGNKNTYSTYDKTFENKISDNNFAVCFKGTDVPIIYCLPDESDLKDNYKDFVEFTDDKLSLNKVINITFLFEVILSVLNFDLSDNAIINRRLNLFCFKNFIYLNNNNSISSKEKKQYRKELFYYILYFHPCSEDFRELFSLKNGAILYEGEVTDLVRFCDSLFGFIYENKEKFNSLNDVEIHQIEPSHALLRKMLTTLLGDQPSVHLDKDNLFDFEDYFFLYANEKDKFYENLMQSIRSYIITSWENDSLSVSLYYGSTSNLQLEQYISHPENISPHDKYISEYFIETYLFYILRNIDKFQELIFHLKENAEILQKMLAIALSHPFISLNSKVKMNLVKSGIIDIVPNGFARDKLIAIKKKFNL